MPTLNGDSSALCPRGKIAVNILVSGLYLGKSKSWAGMWLEKLSLHLVASEKTLWNTALLRSRSQGVVIPMTDDLQKARGFSLVRGILPVSIPALQTRFSARVPDYKSAVNVLMPTRQDSPGCRSVGTRSFGPR